MNPPPGALPRSIAQISDLHVRPRGRLLHDVVDSNRMLADAIAHLNSLQPRPELVVITGDLVDEGLAAEYEMLRELLAALELPWCVMPGNHDRRDLFLEVFADQPYLPRHDEPVCFVLEGFALRIVAVDTTVPGRHHGEVTEASLAWLDAALRARPEQPTLLLMHHPPVACGIPYLDKYRCMAPESLAALVSRNPQIERVACGHLHRPIMVRWAATVLCSSPSTCSQIALGLTPDAPARSWLEPPACLIHWAAPGLPLVTHSSPIGRFEGPFAFA